MLMHQGESDNGDTTWPSKVRLVYDNLLKDLDLQPEKVPLLAGEMVSAAEGGICAGMNTIIATLPQEIPNSYVISSEGLPRNTRSPAFHLRRLSDARKKVCCQDA